MVLVGPDMVPVGSQKNHWVPKWFQRVPKWAQWVPKWSHCVPKWSRGFGGPRRSGWPCESGGPRGSGGPPGGKIGNNASGATWWPNLL